MKNKLFFLFSFLLLTSFISAGELKVTQEHPFLINGSWIDASQLKVGDELTLVNGSKVTITKLTDVVANESFKVYNLEAGEYHNFVVGKEGVVVHNSNKIDKEIIHLTAVDHAKLLLSSEDVNLRIGKIIGDIELNPTKFRALPSESYGDFFDALSENARSVGVSQAKITEFGELMGMAKDLKIKVYVHPDMDAAGLGGLTVGDYIVLPKVNYNSGFSSNLPNNYVKMFEVVYHELKHVQFNSRLYKSLTGNSVPSGKYGPIAKSIEKQMASGTIDMYYDSTAKEFLFGNEISGRNVVKVDVDFRTATEFDAWFNSIKLAEPKTTLYESVGPGLVAQSNLLELQDRLIPMDINFPKRFVEILNKAGAKYANYIEPVK